MDSAQSNKLTALRLLLLTGWLLTPLASLAEKAPSAERVEKAADEATDPRPVLLYSSSTTQLPTHCCNQSKTVQTAVFQATHFSPGEQKNANTKSMIPRGFSF